ncbi:hypothetical protein [Epilithonimonas xixisoli]|uniref:DUF4142 domain-containing protein n=1 Tax=Epilithonimonas xixisoli TaxID=1476462 RepID=A0A4V3H2U0_9FLAO|nr:hypothetical protein [Epilithonimonas xixisoli]TDX86321.1 hypothetical protein B0I22_0435 [Epilithonimonas xixisoli]
MKKLLMAAFVFASLTSAIAQTSREDFKASMERVEKLGKLSAPKTTSVTTLDKLNSEIGDSAKESMKISPLLQNLYYRSIGQTNDGVTDVKVKKPTLKECEELALRIFSQSKNVQAFAANVTSVSSESMSVTNPLKLAKIGSAVKYAKNASTILGEESVFQTKAIKSIIQTVKSAGNL